MAVRGYWDHVQTHSPALSRETETDALYPLAIICSFYPGGSSIG